MRDFVPVSWDVVNLYAKGIDDIIPGWCTDWFDGSLSHYDVSRVALSVIEPRDVGIRKQWVDGGHV